MDAAERFELELLRVFYQKVALLTMDHDVIGDHAAVFPSKLGSLLERVDADWTHKVAKWERRRWPRPKKRVSVKQDATKMSADDADKANRPMADDAVR